MKTIQLKSTQTCHYQLEVPDENYSKVLEMLGKSSPYSDEIDTDAIIRHPVVFMTGAYFSEELHSLCECDVSDDDYSLNLIDTDA